MDDISTLDSIANLANDGQDVADPTLQEIMKMGMTPDKAPTPSSGQPADFSQFQDSQNQAQQPSALDLTQQGQVMPAQRPPMQPPNPANYTVPAVVNLIKGLIHPQTGVGGRPESRAGVFESFMGNLFSNMAEGLKESGTGPGANVRAFAGALTAPFQRDVTGYQLQQQATEQQAKIAAMTAQPRTDPQTGQYLGVMNDQQYSQYIAANYKGLAGAKVKALSDVEKANIGARAKITASQLQIDAQNQRVAFMKPAINPVTNRPEYEMFDRMGSSMGFAEHTVVSQLLSHENKSVQFMQDGQGNLHVLPKTTVSGPVIPGAQPQTGAPQAVGQTAPTGQPGAIPAVQQPAGAQPAGAPISRIPKPSGGAGRIVPGFQGKAALESGYAYDQDNHLIATTRSDANTSGLSGFMPVTPAEMDKHKNQLRQLNDVQTNKSRYALAAQNYQSVPVPTRIKDEPLINDIINKAGVGDFNIAISEGGKVTLPVVSSFLEGLSREMRSASYANLSPEGKELIDSYYNSMSAVPAYQKALTGIGRTNKEMLDLELANVPPPTYGPSDIIRKLNRFQQNIDRAAEGFPRFKDMQMPSDVRRDIEQPKRPRANFASLPNPF